MTLHPPSSLAEVVENGLCIGCGLCAALSETLDMVLTEDGAERPAGQVTRAEEKRILAACPGAVIAAHIEEGAEVDTIWGAHKRLVMAWSAEPDVRFQASTGGVLTALGRYMLASGKANFVLHVGVHPDDPLRSAWVMSETPDEVLMHSGSRYGPVAVLEGLGAALARAEPFAVIAKPCDVGAVRLLARTDARVAQFCQGLFTMVCGGSPSLSKTTDAVAAAGVASGDVKSFRYRGFGTPGPHRITRHDGTYVDVDYNTMWGRDEADWRIQSRCKICADPIGEAADIAAADTWVGGKPEGDGPGFNGLLVRTTRGRDILEGAIADGFMTVGEDLSPDDFSSWQPHNVRKKRAILPRLQGMADGGNRVPRLVSLREATLAEGLASAHDEREGARERTQVGRFAETSRITAVE